MRPPAEEENFQIFYLIQDGLEPEEREEFGLRSIEDDILSASSFLGGGSAGRRCGEREANAARFREWRRDLARLGINFRQGLRILFNELPFFNFLQITKFLS